MSDAASKVSLLVPSARRQRHIGLPWSSRCGGTWTTRPRLPLPAPHEHRRQQQHAEESTPHASDDEGHRGGGAGGAHKRGGQRLVTVHARRVAAANAVLRPELPKAAAGLGCGGRRRVDLDLDLAALTGTLGVASTCTRAQHAGAVGATVCVRGAAGVDVIDDHVARGACATGGADALGGAKLKEGIDTAVALLHGEQAAGTRGLPCVRYFTVQPTKRLRADAVSSVQGTHSMRTIAV